MYKLIAFDLDGTLAEIGKGIERQTLIQLQQLEANGMRIAICSGKPVQYLCGFMRQVNLTAPILIGENGGVIQFGINLPPENYYVVPYSDAAKRSIRLLRDAIDKSIPDVWYQQNQIALTPFPKNEQEFDAISSCIHALEPELQDVTVYRHSDCFDILPSKINKRTGLLHLGKLLRISPEETIAVGDGVNDYPMFDYAGLSLGIHVSNSGKVDHNFTSINDALDFLINTHF